MNTLNEEVCAALLQRNQPALAYRQRLAARLKAQAAREPATLDELVERFALRNRPDVPWRELFEQMRTAGVLV